MLRVSIPCIEVFRNTEIKTSSNALKTSSNSKDRLELDRKPTIENKLGALD